jgi:hypothetical protein
MDWATFWATFSKTHLVTLLLSCMAVSLKENKEEEHFTKMSVLGKSCLSQN